VSVRVFGDPATGGHVVTGDQLPIAARVHTEDATHHHDGLRRAGPEVLGSLERTPAGPVAAPERDVGRQPGHDPRYSSDHADLWEAAS
jgi:hypothetical protein